MRLCRHIVVREGLGKSVLTIGNIGLSVERYPRVDGPRTSIGHRGNPECQRMQTD